MKPKRQILPALFLFLFLVVGVSLTMFLSQQPPAPLPASIPASEFSAERAFKHIEALADEPLPWKPFTLNPGKRFGVFRTVPQNRLPANALAVTDLDESEFKHLFAERVFGITLH